MFLPQQVVELDVMRVKYQSCKRQLAIDSIMLNNFNTALVVNDSIKQSMALQLNFVENNNKQLRQINKRLQRDLFFEKKKKYFVGGSFLIIFGLLKYLKVF